MMVRYLYKLMYFIKVKIIQTIINKKTGKKIYFYQSFLLFFNQYKNSNIWFK